MMGEREREGGREGGREGERHVPELPVADRPNIGNEHCTSDKGDFVGRDNGLMYYSFRKSSNT
jgi:hypothetical protein